MVEKGMGVVRKRQTNGMRDGGVWPLLGHCLPGVCGHLWLAVWGCPPFIPDPPLTGHFSLFTALCATIHVRAHTHTLKILKS